MMRMFLKIVVGLLLIIAIFVVPINRNEIINIKVGERIEIMSSYLEAILWIAACLGYAIIFWAVMTIRRHGWHTIWVSVVLLLAISIPVYALLYSVYCDGKWISRDSLYKYKGNKYHLLVRSNYFSRDMALSEIVVDGQFYKVYRILGIISDGSGPICVIEGKYPSGKRRLEWISERVIGVMDGNKCYLKYDTENKILLNEDAEKDAEKGS